MIIRGIVDFFIKIISVIAKAVAWFLIALGLWLPAIYSIVFFIVCAATKTDFSSITFIFFAGLVFTTIISVWYTLSTGGKKSGVERKKPSVPPAYLPKMQERDLKVEFKSSIPPNGSIFRPQYEQELCEDDLSEQSNKRDYNSLKREYYNEMQNRHNDGREEPHRDSPRDIRRNDSRYEDPNFHPYHNRRNEAASVYDNRGGYDNGGFGNYSDNKGSDEHPLRQRENVQFKSYHPNREEPKPTLYDNPNRGYENYNNGYNNYNNNYNTNNGNYNRRDDCGKDSLLRKQEGVQFQSYHPNSKEQKPTLYDNPNGGSSANYNSYNYERRDERGKDSLLRQQEGMQFQSYHPQMDNSNSSYDNRGGYDDRGYYDNDNGYDNGYRNDGYGYDNQDYSNRPYVASRNETPRIFLSRHDATVLIYEYSDRLEYYKKTSQGLMLDGTRYKY